jgi:hypothetical protein
MGEKEQASPEEIRAQMRDIVPLWMRIGFGIVGCLVAVTSLRHGLWNSGVLLGIFIASSGFVLGEPPDSAGRYLKRPQGILYVLAILAFTAWSIRDGYRVPGIGIGGASLFALFSRPKHEGESSAHYYLPNPLPLISTALFLTVLVWSAWTTGGWVPISCVIATFCLAERNFKTRRSLKENLTRPTVAVRVALAAIAGLWAWMHPTYWNVVTPIIIIVLMSADIYLHTASREEPLALSHPQS